MQREGQSQVDTYKRGKVRIYLCSYQFFPNKMNTKLP